MSDAPFNMGKIEEIAEYMSDRFVIKPVLRKNAQNLAFPAKPWMTPSNRCRRDTFTDQD